MVNIKENYESWTTTCSSMCATPSFNEDRQNEKKREPKLVYGLQGLATFLHMSVTTAWRLKASGKYDAAISQHGRCIITDTEKLLELMRLDQQTEQTDFFTYYNNMY